MAERRSSLGCGGRSEARTQGVPIAGFYRDDRGRGDARRHARHLRFVAPRKFADLGTIPVTKRDSIAVNIFLFCSRRAQK